jgi:hypothetical protein
MKAIYKWIETHPEREILAVAFEEHTQESHRELKRMGYRKTTAVAIDEDGSWIVMYERKR